MSLTVAWADFSFSFPFKGKIFFLTFFFVIGQNDSKAHFFTIFLTLKSMLMPKMSFSARSTVVSSKPVMTKHPKSANQFQLYALPLLRFFSQVSVFCSNTDDKGKGKAIPLQSWTGPESSRRLRLSDFKTIGT